MKRLWNSSHEQKMRFASIFAYLALDWPCEFDKSEVAATKGDDRGLCFESQ